MYEAADEIRTCAASINDIGERMEYRQLPRGNSTERFSVIGLGMGVHDCSDEEIERILRKAFSAGINFIDACCIAQNFYGVLGKVIREMNIRDRVFLQVHFGAVYNTENAEYAWSRDYDLIKETFDRDLELLETDYADFGMLHCIDDEADLEEMKKSGLFDHVRRLKEKGVIRHIGFSSHTPSLAHKILDTGLIDMMMFSINPAYDAEKGDEWGKGEAQERAALFRRCEKEGVGISVMKPFYAGKLLKADESPFGKALTVAQCLQYALDRPAVLTVVPGISNEAELDEFLSFTEISPEEKDYSVIAGLTAGITDGTCVYCNHCRPCPAGIDIGLVNKYYDLAKAGDVIADGHYDKLSVRADACTSCGHCDERCPFHVRQSERMAEIAAFFRKG
ncbi:MAG: aldo/keto reductase [Methanosarcinaceae archaeon]|nr:aldo/keto reductase [Methanosarcinaceae archaeon]